ncbi:MAG: triose-phosphate isomerase [Acidimicrobiales bacterium]|nr:triose-phosphate isomerase [Acidimicrobiales bacterium]
MARMPIISGNWKMHHNHLEAIQLVQKLSYELKKEDIEAVEVTVHPPFTDLRSVQTVLDSDGIPIALGAQHCHFEEKGAFTGEVAPSMLAKLMVTYVITGHSERREIFGETDEDVNKKVKAILKHEMTPILCCGETLEEREAGDAETKVAGQVLAGLKGLSADQVQTCVVAYEPIWAIGTGVTATPQDAQEMCKHVRETLRGKYGDTVADAVRIQYGGSVKPGNAPDLMAQPDIDGALVGGASLDAVDFARIIQYRLAI